MKLVDVFNRLLEMNLNVFQTSDVMAYLTIPAPHASILLRRLTDAGQLINLRRGIWAIPGKTDPLALPEILTRPFPSYVSLQTALYHHGLITQIPSVIYAISLARTRVYKTQVGEFSIHHIEPSFFFGFESTGDHGVNMAIPEKALLDTLYLSPAKSNLFHSLPEIEFPKNFDFDLALRIIRRIPFRSRRALIERAFNRLIENCIKEGSLKIEVSAGTANGKQRYRAIS